MSYDEEIEKTGIREHPLTAFQNMGSLSEGDDFAVEFAELLDILSKNIVIPVELIDENADAFDEYEGETKEDILKEWAAEHAKGEEVYAKMDGLLQIIDVPAEDDIGPDDVDVKGVGGGLGEVLENAEPGQALIATEDGVQSQDFSADVTLMEFHERGLDDERIDVSDYYHWAQFTISSEGGGDGSERGSNSPSAGDGGSGIFLVGEVLLDEFEELKVYTSQGTHGYRSGEGGDSGDFGGDSGGSGAGSSAIIGIKPDGTEVTCCHLGGGGGGGGANGRSTSMDCGGDGGDGGGPGGEGGDRGCGDHSLRGQGEDGGDGELEYSEDHIRIITQERYSDDSYFEIFQ